MRLIALCAVSFIAATLSVQAGASVACEGVKLAGIYDLRGVADRHILLFKELASTPGVYRVSELAELCSDTNLKCAISSGWKVLRGSDGKDYREIAVGFSRSADAVYSLASLQPSGQESCSLAWYDPMRDGYELNSIQSLSPEGDISLGVEPGRETVGVLKWVGSVTIR